MKEADAAKNKTNSKQKVQGWLAAGHVTNQRQVMQQHSFREQLTYVPDTHWEKNGYASKGCNILLYIIGELFFFSSQNPLKNSERFEKTEKTNMVFICTHTCDIEFVFFFEKKNSFKSCKLFNLVYLASCFFSVVGFFQAPKSKFEEIRTKIV